MEQRVPSSPSRACSQARAELGADVDPEALTVMASAEADFAAIDASLARAQAGIAQRDEQRALVRAERERAAVDEPAVDVDVQAGLEVGASAKAEADDAELEI
jgi:type IV secretory pathway VirD2 relaxase